LEVEKVNQDWEKNTDFLKEALGVGFYHQQTGLSK
jgi:hypothetical protein